jgi:hypothetical protein
MLLLLEGSLKLEQGKERKHYVIFGIGWQDQQNGKAI